MTEGAVSDRLDYQKKPPGTKKHTFDFQKFQKPQPEL